MENSDEKGYCPLAVVWQVAMGREGPRHQLCVLVMFPWEVAPCLAALSLELVSLQHGLELGTTKRAHPRSALGFL